MSTKRASFCRLPTPDSALTTETTKMDKVLSVLLGVIEKVLSGVPIRLHSVTGGMLCFQEFAP